MLAVDLFSGAGGMSLGAIAAGCRVALAVEIETNAARTYQLNHPGTTVLNVDICAYRPRKRMAGEKGEPTMIFGGPPCQGFSTSNQRTRNTLNPTNWLFEEYFRVAKILRPDWIVIENVRGLLETVGADRKLTHLDR